MPRTKRLVNGEEKAAYHTALAILQIRGLSALRNLFLLIISGLKMFLCPNERRFLSRFTVWTGFIR